MRQLATFLNAIPVGRSIATAEYSRMESDDMRMDFIVGLPLMARKFDSIWVIMDRLSKSTHFIHACTSYNF
jgi:hypothetical protein